MLNRDMYVYVHEFTRYRQRGGTSPLKVNPEVITPRRREEVLRPSPREERRPRPTLKRVFFFLKNSTYFNSFGRRRVSILTRVSLASSYAVTRRFCASRILPRIRIFFSSSIRFLYSREAGHELPKRRWKDNGYDFDSSSRLSFPIIHSTGWRCFISLLVEPHIVFFFSFRFVKTNIRHD